MVLKIFNTLTRKKETFEPIKKGIVKMYSCGPTVYNYVHIGNLRAFLVSDLIVRYLKFKGYKVHNIMNLTDVDDKTIKGAKEENISLKEYTDKYIKAFFDDLNTLNVEKAKDYPRATEYIPEMVELVKKLKEKGFTYEKDGSIYFKISAFNEYGKLANLNLKKLLENAQGRLDDDNYDKENARDFVLWKGYKKGDISWDTEIGKGRPGWHIECSAMAIKNLGDTFDIHTGGIDLVFPHHTNEIAQSEASTGKKFVNYWLHNEYLFVEGEKMSKSLGNFFTLRELLEKGFDPMAIRYELISTNYKMPLNFTFKGVEASTSALKKINNFIKEINEAPQGKIDSKIILKTESDFELAMDDNLNVSKALSVLFEFIKEIYKKGIVNDNALIKLLKKIDSVLGVMDFSNKGQISSDIESLIKQRDDARASKNWTLADKIRDELSSKGIELLDTPEGTKWRKN